MAKKKKPNTVVVPRNPYADALRTSPSFRQKGHYHPRDRGPKVTDFDD